MGKPKLTVASIVASSTDTAWSQTYHAGGVTAIVTVRQKEEQTPTSLSLVGKDLLNTFESEYFTLETKNLTSIKEAVALTYNKSRDTHDVSLIVSAVVQNAVYVVLAGSGKILLIRKGNLATLLEQTGTDVLSASGFLESGDVMILQTPSFEEKVSSSLLLSTLSENSVPTTAEILSPTIHRESDGAATALLFSFDEQPPIPLTEHAANPEEKEETAIPPTTFEKPLPEDESAQIYAPSNEPEKKKKRLLTHRQKIFLTIAVILAVVFVGAIYFSLQKKQSSQNSALFSQLYTPAERKYEEGQGLQDLNASLAHDDFVQAQQMLQSAKGKFPATSSEEKQIVALLDKVNAALGGTGSSPTMQTTPVTKIDATTSPFLAFAQKHPSTKYLAQDDTNFYFADNTGITKVAKSSGTEKQIIQNGGDWKSLGGFQTYLGNMYILDTSDGIDKYPVAASGYGNKVAYFTDTTPDLTKAVSLAIDGSLWILTSDGTISKYTKGKQDTFTLTGLTKSLSSPTELVTTVDDDNIYILDSGNSRLVVLKKDGTFVNDYTAPELKTATQLDVNESGKQAFFLSGGTIYQLDLK